VVTWSEEDAQQSFMASRFRSESRVVAGDFCPPVMDAPRDGAAGRGGERAENAASGDQRCRPASSRSEIGKSAEAGLTLIPDRAATISDLSFLAKIPSAP